MCGRHLPGVFVAALALLVGVLGIVSAASAKKSGSAAVASTKVAFGTSQSKTTSAKCPGGMHVTGGGFSVSPAYDGALGTGIRSFEQVSRPSGKKRWEVGGGGLASPIATGSLTAYAACERTSTSSISKPFDNLSNPAVVAPGGAQTTIYSCPPKTRAIFGGFAAPLPFAAANPASSQLVIASSRRLSSRSWSVSAYNASTTVPSPLAFYAACEHNGGSLTARSKTVAIANDTRTTASASCKRSEHIVSGGFAVAPAPVAGGSVPRVGVDVNRPMGNGKGWQAGLYEEPTYNVPPGSTLTAQALCRKNG